MLSHSPPSLSNLSCIRMAYSMWIRHDLTIEGPRDRVFDRLVDTVLADVQSLPLPEKLISPILQLVRPVGKHLLWLLSLWLPKTQLEKSQKWLTRDILSACLTLNTDGLINQRKTAEKILSTGLLHNTIAFRLACVTFLEEEVLKLWPFVKQYILNKIILESEHPLGEDNLFLSPHPDGMEESYSDYSTEIDIKMCLIEDLSFKPRTTEPDEVLFWNSYCMSKENAIDMKEWPHFKGDDVEWCEFCLEQAALSGNVACFDYFKNYRYRNFEYDHLKMIEQILKSTEDAEPQLPSFIFNFILCDAEEKVELFRKFPREMVSQFLQWPLSLKFVENAEELWSLISAQECFVFYKIFVILLHSKVMLLNFDHPAYYQLRFAYPGMMTGTYNLEHLRSIWIALWKISDESYKLNFLYVYVFSCFENFNMNDSSELMDELLYIFLSSGELVLELFEASDMKETLRNLAAKHLPEVFEDLDQTYISVLNLKKHRMHDKKLREITQLKARICRPNYKVPMEQKFVNSTKGFLFSSNDIQKYLFYEVKIL